MLVKKLVLLAAAAFIIPNCGQGDLHIKVRYDHILGLKKGDRLLFEQNEIGKVESVVYSTQADYLVGLIFNKEFANAATEHSRFVIVSDPASAARKAVELIQTQKGGTRLADGAVVQGSTLTSQIVDNLLRDLEKGADLIKKNYERFLDGLQRIPESEEIQSLKEELDNLVQALKQSSQKVRDKIQKEILPRLQQELERLKAEFGKRDRKEEQDLQDLETQLEHIKKI